MYDKFNRHITYLRISVTDRCNLRCAYCMPEGGIHLLKHEDILTFDEIVETVNHAVMLGISKIRLTGGEPLVRKGIVNLVQMIAEIPGIDDLSLTTNGILLKEFAQPLAEAGLSRVNISLDTINPEKFRAITRGGDIPKVLEGIETAEKTGLKPIKINCVVENTSDEPDAKEVAEFASKAGFEVRFIKRMSLETGIFSIVDGGTGGDCSKCNRLRLTSDGFIKPCLFSDLGFNVREMGAEQAIKKAVEVKPECGTTSSKNLFYNIGG